jgi:hypothetical protein
MIRLGNLQRTPWWLRLFGFPAQRRWNVTIHIGGVFGEWEYLP